MKKKAKQFRPSKISRYLIGSVKKDVWMTDLKEYNSHRFKVFTAQTKTDCRPPKMNPFNYVNRRKLSTDAERLRLIDKHNRNLLRNINLINRTIGRIDSYNPEAYFSKSKWQSHERNMKKIETHNKVIYASIEAARSTYNRESMRQFWIGIVEKLKLGAKYPLVILQKTPSDNILSTLPSISVGLEKLSDRPLCFMEFQVQNGPLLGRVIIELYHDHVPVTVQNFITTCTGENKYCYKNCLIYRIVPGKYLETGDVTKNNGRGGASIYGKHFAEEGHRLRHTKAGVLSMVRVGKHSNNSKFCITFAKMDTLDHQNVVFGKIIKGADNLLKIEGYGRRIGKPLAPIVISNCGKL